MKANLERSEKQNQTLKEELRQLNLTNSKLEAKLEEVQSRETFADRGELFSHPQRSRKVAMPTNERNDSSPINWPGESSGAERRKSTWLQQSEDTMDQSPFRGQTKKSKTPHPVGNHGGVLQDYSPIKGRIDPNINQFARQNPQVKQSQTQQLQTMTVAQLLSYKQDVSKVGC